MDNNEMMARDLLVNDIEVLLNGVKNKDLESLDLDKIMEYLELLKNETERVKNGIYARDNSIRYTNGEISFEKAREL